MIKIVYYEFVKTIINTVDQVEVIIDMVIKYHGLPEFIISNWGSLFILKF